MNQTMNVSSWRTADGSIHLIAANLEEGLRNCADMSRRAVLVIPTFWKVTEFIDWWKGKRFPVRSNRVAIDLGHVESVLLSIYSRS
jgi:hypothetical protein